MKSKRIFYFAIETFANILYAYYNNDYYYITLFYHYTVGILVDVNCANG